MLKGDIYVGAVGVKIYLLPPVDPDTGLPIDLTGATVQWVVESPANSEQNLSASVGAEPLKDKNGTLYEANKWAYYTLLGSEFTVTGKWTSRVNVTDTNGNVFIGDPFTFTVGN